MVREWKPKWRVNSSVDLRQHAQAATCEYGYLRVVTRTKSLHRRRTRFPLKVRAGAGVFAPARLFCAT